MGPMNDREPSKDVVVLQLVGLSVLGLAAAFSVAELELERPLLVLPFSAMATLLALRDLGGWGRWLTPLILLGAVVVSGATWLSLKWPVLLVGVLLPVVGAGWVALRLARMPAVPAAKTEALPRLPELLTWQTIGLGLLSLTGGVYFHLLTLRVDHLARRPVLTLAWAVLGVGAVLLGRKRSDSAPRDAGFVVLAAAVLKVMLYDTTHLFGVLRIAALGAVGAVFLAGAHLLRRAAR